MSESVHGTNLKNIFVPMVDAEALSHDAEAITSATDYDGDFIDLGNANNGSPNGLGLWFIPSSTLAGGTSLQFILLSDADGVAGSEVVEVTSKVVALADYAPIFIAIPNNLGKRYIKARVASLGTHSAGSVTSFLGRLK
jgi:hypothetical protein